MNEPFTILRAVAAPLPLENIDTDLIWPARPNISLRRGEQAGNAFATLRFAPDGAKNPGFILNRAPWREARILVAGRNFGCGSSRELAVWALYEYGIRCVIAASFGDIFYNNASLNGLLPVMLPEPQVAELLARTAEPETCILTVDLEKKRVTGEAFDEPFSIDRHRRECLLRGLDEITATLSQRHVIAAFAKTYWERYPWSRPQNEKYERKS